MTTPSHTNTYNAGEALAANVAVYFDGADGENLKTLATATDRRFAGITAHSCSDDEDVTITTFGICRAKVSGTVETGDLLMPTTAGALTKLTAGNIPCAVYLGRGRDSAQTDAATTATPEVFVLGQMARAMGPRCLRAVKTHDFGAIADEGSDSTTVAVTGASVGDTVIVNAPSLEAGLVVTGYVNAADTVTIVARCFKAAGVDAASQDFIVTVLTSTDLVPA